MKKSSFTPSFLLLVMATSSHGVCFTIGEILDEILNFINSKVVDGLAYKRHSPAALYEERGK